MSLHWLESEGKPPSQARDIDAYFPNGAPRHFEHYASQNIYLHRSLIITLAMQQNPISGERYLHLSVHADYSRTICRGDKVSDAAAMFFFFLVILMFYQQSEVDYLE